MSQAGTLRRIIVIRFGRLEFANISLDRSVHLYGTNNVGKSTIANSLLFLFVNSTRDMGFDKPDAKDYYFASEYSMALFECLTASNRTVTVGVRRTLRLGRVEFERFVFDGAFQRDDFFDEHGVCRERSELDALLVGKNIRPLDGRYIPNMITGIAADAPESVPMIGVVPLRRLDDYPKFIVLFRNLLKLSKLTQDELKQTFVTIFRHDIACDEVLDLSTESRELLALEEKERREIDILSRLERSVAEAVEARKTWEFGRRRLPAIFALIERRKGEERERLEAELKLAEKGVLDTSDQMKTVAASVLSFDRENNALNQLLGQKRGAVDQHTAAGEKNKWPEFMETFQQEARNNLSGRIETALKELGEASRETAEQVSLRLKALRAKHLEKTRFRDNFEHSFGAVLCKLLPPDVVTDGFRLINPSMLALSTQGDISIHAPDRLSAAIQQAAEVSRSGQANFAGFSFVPQALDAPSVKNYLQLDQLQAEITLLEGQIAESNAQLAVINSQSERTQAIRRMQDELRNLDLSLSSYRLWMDEKKTKVPEWNAQITEINGKISFNHDQKLSAEGKIEALRQSIETFQQKVRETKTTLGRIQSLSCRRPDWDGWQTEVSHDNVTRYESMTLFDLVAFYDDDLDRAYSSRDKFSNLVLVLRNETHGAYDQGGDEATLDRLDEAIIGLPERRHEYERQVGYLVTTLRSGANGVLKGLHTLEEKIKEFNRQLGSVAVSDLRSITVDMFRRSEELVGLNAIVAVDEGDLFGSPTAIEDIKRRIRERPQFKLTDLFGLEATVVDAQGKTAKYADISGVHSNGTTIAIKVFLCMMLLRRFIHGKRETSIPFYVDEVGVLDTNNSRKMIEFAPSIGFLPIFASPSASGIARMIYCVADLGNGTSAVEDKSKIERTPQAKAA